MTNAEKYLKDEKVTEELIATMENELPLSYVDVVQFWEKTCKPTLTQDERTILSHINVYEFDKIGRANNGDLYLHYRDDKDTEDFWWCNHIFQFIKERRRI